MTKVSHISSNLAPYIGILSATAECTTGTCLFYIYIDVREYLVDTSRVRKPFCFSSSFSGKLFLNVDFSPLTSKASPSMTYSYVCFNLKAADQIHSYLFTEGRTHQHQSDADICEIDFTQWTRNQVLEPLFVLDYCAWPSTATITP